MRRPFSPKVQPRKFRGKTWYEVDCRAWPELMARLDAPLRSRFPSETEAEKHVRKLLVAESIGVTPSAPERVAVRDLCELYLRSVRKSSRSEVTHKQYQSRLRKFLAFLQARGISSCTDVSRAVIQAYREELYDALEPISAYGCLSAVQQFFRWCVRMQYLEFAPTEGLVPRKPKVRRRCLDARELKVVVSSCCAELRDSVLLFLMTGIRRGEYTSLSVGQVVLESPTPHLRRIHGKGGKLRDVFLEGEAQAVAGRLVDDALEAGRERLSPYSYGRIGTAWAQERDRLELPGDVTIHVFRHTAATILANSGLPLTEVRDILGHSSVKQTEVYVHPDRNSGREGLRRLASGITAVSVPELEDVSVGGSAG